MATNSPAAPAPTTSISIDLVNDLNGSALQALLTSQPNPIFDIAGEIFEFADDPVAKAAAAKASAAITLNAPAAWTLPNGIAFSLTDHATCSISIDTVSETFAVATTLDATTTSNIVAGPTSDIVYINIDLDFGIQGNIAGGADINGIGIAGTVAGGRSATLSFCQPVDATLTTLDAVKQALSQIVFPLDPGSVIAMQTGAVTRVLFDGTFSAELDVTYGLGDHIFAAPSAGAALASLGNVVSLTPASLEINAGTTGSLTYSHTDHYALVIDKATSTVATAYLIRTLSNDTGLAAGIKVGVTATDVSVAVVPAALQTVVMNVTGSPALATTVVNAALQPVNNLTTSLNARLAAWATDITGDIGLSASLSRQSNRTALFVFDVDLTVAALDMTRASWTALIAGDLSQAIAAGGLKLQPGSGVSENLKRSSTIQFQFFNFFQSTTVTDFFKTASAELGPDGTIRLLATIGDETKTATKKTFTALRIYFVVTANQIGIQGVSAANVDLRVELSEAGRQRSGATFADTLVLAPQRLAISSARRAVASYLGGHPNGNLTLIYDIKSSAFPALTFTPFSGSVPIPLPHPADQANWTIFQAATAQLIRDLNITVSPLTFGDWAAFNLASIDENGSSANPDRSQTGDPAAGEITLHNPDTRKILSYFLQASQGFMNLCEHLANLAQSTAAAVDLAHYNKLLAFLTLVITKDVFLDYGVPSAAALVHQLGAGATQVTSSATPATDGSALTCTVTIS